MPFVKATPGQSLLELQDAGSPVDWYLAFTDSDVSIGWWSRFLKTGFAHVQAYRVLDDRVVNFMPNAGFTDITLHTFEELQEFAELQDVVIIHVTEWREIERYRVPWLFAPFTCVEQIKALLGIRKFWLFTPYQLYKHLGAGHDRPI